MRIFLFLILLPTVLAELVFVVGIWRHGDRAPKELPYPTDIYNETYWPRGWNQLTNVGIQETYSLGKWLRSRYIDSSPALLDKQFDRKQVFIRSTDSERAISSALSVTTGMYPSTGNFIWNQNELNGWQPVPVHTNGYGEDDPLLKPTSIECPNYSTLTAAENRDFLDELSEKYADLFPILSNYTGMEINIGNVKGLYDITREMANSLPAPKWVYSTWNGSTILDHIKELKRLTRTSEFNSPGKSKFRGGFLLNDFVEKLSSAATNSSTEKAVFYSSHDGTVTALTYAMGVNNNQLLPYAATFLAELHKTGSNYNVQLFFKNGTDSVFRLKLPNCAEECPLDEFIHELEPMRIRSKKELYELCGSSTFGLSLLVAIFISILNAC